MMGEIRFRRPASAAAVRIDALESRMLLAAPAAPTSLKVSVVSSGNELQVNWKDNSSNESGFAIYSGYSPNALVRIATVGKNKTSYKQAPPDKGVTYYAQVRAYNANGESKPTSTIPVILPATSAPKSVPATPGSLAAKVVNGSQIQLTWSDKSNNEGGFEIYRGTSKSSLSKIATVGANTTRHTDASASKGKTYYYNVRAYNAKGKSGATSTVSAKVSSTAPSAPVPASPPTSPSKPSGNDRVVYIGSGRSVTSLNSAPWPKKGDAPVVFRLDPGSYSTGLRFIDGTLTIESADASNPATIKLPDVWDSKGVAGNPTLSVRGSLTIRNIRTTGGEDTILLGSFEGASIIAEKIRMDGGAIWRGNGAKSAIFRNNEVHGKPRANVYSSYGGSVGTCIIDHSGTNVPVQQGGRISNGNPLGEAAIRIMNVNQLTLQGIKTKPWFYAPGKVWKQDVQLRPSSNTIRVINCNFYQVDVGDMTWRKPAQPIRKVEFINCTFVKSPNVTAGVDTIVFSSTKIGGSTWSKTVNY